MCHRECDQEIEFGKVSGVKKCAIPATPGRNSIVIEPGSAALKKVFTFRRAARTGLGDILSIVDQTCVTLSADLVYFGASSCWHNFALLLFYNEL